jgi:hypothetical protein
MNVNRLGKLLVFLNLVFSVVALSWAAGVYLQFVDWGWKEPRVELDRRVPSELDKRIAALTESMKAADLVYPDPRTYPDPGKKPLDPLKIAQDNLANAQKRFADNHLFYTRELARLRLDPNPIDIKGVKLPSNPALDSPTIGKPVLDEANPDIDQSWAKYVADLHDKQKEIKKVSDDIDKEIAEQKKITLWLNDDVRDKEIVKKGLYTLLKEETDLQTQIKFERDYIQPQWVEALETLSIHKERRIRLEKRLDELKRFRLAQGQQ